MTPKTILIIDDSATDRTILRRHLISCSPTAYTIVEAESGVDGWEALETTKPDCLLLDVNLPDFQGTEFLQSLRKQKGSQAPPAVILTGQGSEDLAVHTIKLGAQDYLTKDNLNPDQLHRSIQAAILRAVHQRETEQQQQFLARAHVELQHMTSVLGTDIKQLSESIVHSTSQLVSDSSHEAIPSLSLMETHQSAQSILALVEDLLVFTNLAMESQLPTTEVDLQALVDTVIQTVQKTGSHAQIEIGSLPIILGHSEPLRHLFTHLIQNSLRFSGAEPLHICIGGRTVGTNWHCWVRDNGQGMPLNMLNQLFAAFGQHTGLSENRKAWGLRMAICKRVVDLHQGRIWAESHEGEGTVIHFTIPQ